MFRSKVVPLPAENVDTDQIVPARYLKITDKAGLAEALFCDWRFEADGSLKSPPFVLDRPEMAGRRILLAGDNFGCGSSREHAPWALRAWGIQAVITTSIRTPSATRRPRIAAAASRRSLIRPFVHEPMNTTSTFWPRSGWPGWRSM